MNVEEVEGAEVESLLGKNTSVGARCRGVEEVPVDPNEGNGELVEAALLVALVGKPLVGVDKPPNGVDEEDNPLENPPRTVDVEDVAAGVVKADAVLASDVLSVPKEKAEVVLEDEEGVWNNVEEAVVGVDVVDVLPPQENPVEAADASVLVVGVEEAGAVADDDVPKLKPVVVIGALGVVAVDAVVLVDAEAAVEAPKLNVVVLGALLVIDDVVVESVVEVVVVALGVPKLKLVVEGAKNEVLEVELEGAVEVVVVVVVVPLVDAVEGVPKLNPPVDAVNDDTASFGVSVVVLAFSSSVVVTASGFGVLPKLNVVVVVDVDGAKNPVTAGVATVSFSVADGVTPSVDFSVDLSVAAGSTEVADEVKENPVSVGLVPKEKLGVSIDFGSAAVGSFGDSVVVPKVKVVAAAAAEGSLEVVVSFSVGFSGV